MGVLVAQRFLAVGGEVHHQETAAGPEHTSHFTQDRHRVVGEVKHLMKHHQVHAADREGEVVHVAMAQLDVAEFGLCEGCAREGEHFVRAVNAGRPGGAWGEQAQDAAGSGADVEQVTHRTLAKQVLQSLLDLFFRDME